MLIFEIAQSFFDFYVQEVAGLTSVVVESVVYSVYSVTMFSGELENGNLELKC